ncbi:hypothetical protein M0R45_027624 [Rubus argutus]|uniref:Uncharacterized protein n=1 Tax=Rubus argutus TaxID=59490 RepID=A0AAW1X2B8_RUBAR
MKKQKLSHQTLPWIYPALQRSTNQCSSSIDKSMLERLKQSSAPVARPRPKRAYAIRGGDGLIDDVLSLPYHLLESCSDRGRQG